VNGFTRSNEDTETKRSSEPRVRPARNAGREQHEPRASTNPRVLSVCVRTRFVLLAGGRLRRPLVARVFSVCLRCSVAPCETVGSVIPASSGHSQPALGI
jgi:hypothetical protein